jgi:ankyrin repeat protein
MASLMPLLRAQLDQAIRRNRPRLVRALVFVAPRLLHEKNAAGQLPLHRAARSGSVSLVQYLLRRGAALDARDDSNWTALHHAAEKGHARVIRTLLDLGACLDTAPSATATPLELAEINHFDHAAALLRTHAIAE